MSLTNSKRYRENTLQKILAIERPLAASSSSPDLELIRKLKDKIDSDSPLMRLSMENYELMCNNKMVFNMMVKVLETDAKKLRKICKYLGTFREHINSSPETIKNKIKIHKLQILNLPEELRNYILEMYKRILDVKLRDWIPIEKLDWGNLSGNPNAIKLLDANPEKIDFHNLSGNPFGFDLIKKYAIGKERKSEISWLIMSLNSKEAIDLLEAYIINDNTRTSWYLLAQNPDAISIIRKYPNKINWNALSINSKAIDILRKKWEEEKILIKTKHPIYTDVKVDNIVSWDILSSNTGAIDLLREKIQMEKDMPLSEYNLLQDKEKIDWGSLSENPETVELLEENKGKIVWNNLSGNRSPRATNLLKKRVAYENRLPREEYNRLANKINWILLSANPIAKEILAANIDKIRWVALSNNPKAIDILEVNQDKIDWDTLSGNPSALHILEANQDKIDWERLSMNPSIFVLK